MPGTRVICSLTGVAALALLAGAGGASAATTTVANTDDSGAGSLRDALAAASDGDVIVLPPGTYSITSGQLVVDDLISIRGAGARRTILRSNGSDRVMDVTPVAGSVSLSGLTITGGDTTPTGGGDGGGIESTADLVLTGVAVVGNVAEVANNAAGGGIDGADLVLRDSLIAGNAAYNGGAVHVSNLTMINSTSAGNRAGDPTKNGDSAGVWASDTTIESSTITGNSCFNGAGCGAGVDATATISNSIVAANVAYLDNGQPAGSPGNPGVPEGCIDVITDGGHNISDTADCSFSSPTSSESTDPKLGPLANNGGETDTLALLVGSPALNQGASCPASDQRGVPRALGGVCDIGPYELVRCAGAIVNRVGTGAGDTLVGTGGADGILGLGGNDLLRGLAGGDGLCGGSGRDRLLGGRGRDKLLGGRGRDKLLGGSGRDLLRGGPGRDRLSGGPGRDRQLQ